MSFKVSDKNMLKNYIKIWKKISSLMNIKFDSEPYYGDNDKYMKTKIKLTENKVCINFYGKETPKKKTKKKPNILVFAIDNIIFCS